MTCKVTRLNKDESDKYRKIKLFIGGKYKNEIRNRYYETDFINIHISC